MQEDLRIIAVFIPLRRPIQFEAGMLNFKRMISFRGDKF